jgi:hypothetical protein
MPFLRNVVSSMCDPAVIAIVMRVPLWTVLSRRQGCESRDAGLHSELTKALTATSR